MAISDADDNEPTRAALFARIQELEAQLHENEETLGAIRRGEIDALVMANSARDHQVYTVGAADRPYQVLIEEIQEGALTLDDTGTILYCNRRLASMLAAEQQSLVGRKLSSLVSEPSEVALFPSFLAEAARDGARRELTIAAVDDTQVSVALSLSPLPSDGDFILLCGVVTDMTQHKRHIQELAEANRRLREEIQEREKIEEALRQSQKMEAVGQLTGGLAHDFNNLLTGITAGLELVQTRLHQGRLQGIDRYVGVAQDAARRAAALTHRLLAFSRRQTLAPKGVDLADLVNGMAELIQRTVGPEIIIKVDAPAADRPLVLIDPGQMENALLNLCINARDAMLHGGEIRIDISSHILDAAEARQIALPVASYAILRVTDTGVGIPDEILNRVFDPFFTTKPQGAGTGLGLSMVYGFVQQSGGQVRIASQLGSGTSVFIYLPLHKGQAMMVGPSEGESSPIAGAGQTVLVVDDEPSVRVLVTEVLGDLGYKALEAGDGATALAMLGSDLKINLLISDIGLPGGVNGRQLADAARSFRPTLKVLFITGYAEQSVLKDVIGNSGEVLGKPFNLEVLSRRIAEILH